MTVAVEKTEPSGGPEETRPAQEPAPAAEPRRISRSAVIAAIVVLWLVLFAVLRGRQTLALGAADLTGLHRWFNDVNDSIGANRNSNPLFLYFFNEIRL
ncbi:ABC transporter permease, partial [Streptomyces sp. NPDC020598]